MATISSDILAAMPPTRRGGSTGCEGWWKRDSRHKGVRISEEEGECASSASPEWGSSVPTVGREVQERVAAYLTRMAKVEPESVDVIVDEIGPQ